MLAEVMDHVKMTIPSSPTCSVRGAVNAVCTKVMNHVQMAMLGSPISALTRAVPSTTTQKPNHKEIAIFRGLVSIPVSERLSRKEFIDTTQIPPIALCLVEYSNDNSLNPPGHLLGKLKLTLQPS